MSSFNIRPRFKHSIAASQEEIEKKMMAGLDADDTFIYQYLPGHLNIKLHPSKQHFWSPQLNLSFEQEEDQVIIRGLYGPNPTLWAAFFFGYVAIGIISLFAGMWGMAQWMLGHSHAILWTLPVMAVLAMILYFSAQAGQKLGAQQMFDIHHFYEAMTEDKVPVA